MTKFMLIRKKEALCGALLLLAGLIFLSNLGLDQEFAVDSYLYSNLQKLNGPNEYFGGLKDGKVYDLQPIRDLFFFFDLQGEKIFGFSFKIFTNLILLGLFMFYAYRLIKLFNINEKIFLCVLCLNPILVHIAGIDTSKKHILSAIFILMFLGEYFKNEYKSPGKLIVFLLLSLLSQPINCVLAAIPLIDSAINKRKLQWGVALVLIAGVIIFVNLYYYHFVFSDLAQTSKFTESSVADRVLALGQYFFQLLIPFNLFYFYFKGALTNLIGLAFSVLSIYTILKFFSGRIRWITLVFILGSYLVINIQATQIFHQDSYLLMAVVGFGILLTDLIEKYKYKNVVLGTILVFYLASNIKLLYFKSDYGHFIGEGVRMHPSCRNIYNATRYNFYKKNKEEFLEYGQRMLKGNCVYHARGDEAINLLMQASIVYLTDELSTEQKLNLLTRKNKISDFDQLAIVALYGKLNDSRQFARNLEIYFSKFSPQKINSSFFEDIVLFCERNKNISNCLNLLNLK